MPITVVNIRTLFPIHIPLTVMPGLNRKSELFKQYLRNPENQRYGIILPGQNKGQEYQTISADSWDNRLFSWQNTAQYPGLKIHVFPNNIAIVELDFALDYQGEHEQLETIAQQKSQAIIQQAYPELIAAMSHLEQADNNQYFKLKPEWMQEPSVFWVSRCILLSQQDLANREQQNLVKQWLLHTFRPEDAEDIISGEIQHSLTWLNYVLVDPTPDDPRLDAMVLAQYYYAAQEYCNQGLSHAIDNAYNQSRISDAQKQLSESRVTCRLHQIDYYEHIKYITRSKRLLLESILECWDYDNLKDNGQRMIDVCSSRIEEVENKQRERSSVMTDLLLVALSFFTVFELSLYLMELSREMVSRPALSYTDEDSSFFLEWIAKIDTDIMFGTGFMLTMVLVFVYKFMKSR